MPCSHQRLRVSPYNSGRCANTCATWLRACSSGSGKGSGLAPAPLSNAQTGHSGLLISVYPGADGIGFAPLQQSIVGDRSDSLSFGHFEDSCRSFPQVRLGGMFPHIQQFAPLISSSLQRIGCIHKFPPPSLYCKRSLFNNERSSSCGLFPHIHLCVAGQCLFNNRHSMYSAQLIFILMKILKFIIVWCSFYRRHSRQCRAIFFVLY